MQFADSLEVIAPNANVKLTVTVTGGVLSGVAVQVCDRPELTNCVPKPGVPKGGSTEFDLGKGEDLVGKTVMVDTIIADVGVGAGQARVTWTFQNARKAFGSDPDYEAHQDFPNGDTASHADFEF